MFLYGSLLDLFVCLLVVILHFSTFSEAWQIANKDRTSTIINGRTTPIRAVGNDAPGLRRQFLLGDELSLPEDHFNLPKTIIPPLNKHWLNSTRFIRFLGCILVTLLARPYSNTIFASAHAATSSVVILPSSLSLSEEESNIKSTLSQPEAVALVKRGMLAFQEGKILDSLTYFNKVYDDSLFMRPYLWQRGISLYLNGEYESCADQFRTDVKVNPADTEEAVWALICEAKIIGYDKAQDRMLSVRKDSRRVMEKVERLFRGSKYEIPTDDRVLADDLKQYGDSNGPSSFFYSRLYLSLYYYTKGDIETAAAYAKDANGSIYAASSGDYMTYVARTFGTFFVK